MHTLTLAATQMTCGWDWEANLSKAESLVRNAAQQGAQVILIQELFEGPYFCKDQKPEYFERAIRWQTTLPFSASKALPRS